MTKAKQTKKSTLFKSTLNRKKLERHRPKRWNQCLRNLLCYCVLVLKIRAYHHLFLKTFSILQITRTHKDLTFQEIHNENDIFFHCIESSYFYWDFFILFWYPVKSHQWLVINVHSCSTVSLKFSQVEMTHKASILSSSLLMLFKIT